MNPKTSYSQDSSVLNRLNLSPSQANLDQHTLLISAQAAIQLQTTLLKNSIAQIQSVSGNLILTTTLKSTLETLTKYTQSDQGSIFLIDQDGIIIESILARGPVTRDLKDSLISKVLDDGLAGWTLRHRQIGLIYDTITDTRWVQLPDQPYKVRSALTIPLIYGVDVVGIITLTHAESNHYDEAIALMMQYSIESMTMIILNAQLHSEYRALGVS
jgi:GAF domain-containing protein